jgi:hypothetical protein
MGLFDFFKKKVVPQESQLNKQEEDDLNVESIDIYINFNSPRDQELWDLSSKVARAENIDEEIKSLSALIEYYYQYKNECIAMGEDHYKNFSDMHMHCHNSRNPDFEFIVPHEERLKYIQDNYDTLLQEQQEKIALEAKKQELLQNMDLEKSLQDIILSNPGILQSALYKKYDILLKDSVSEKLYFMAKEGKIKREKSGKTYQLYCIK